MSIKSTTRRLQRSIGSSFLTRGGDDFDHKAANKARREMDSAIIEEQLTEEAVSVTSEAPTNG